MKIADLPATVSPFRAGSWLVPAVPVRKRFKKKHTQMLHRVHRAGNVLIDDALFDVPVTSRTFLIYIHFDLGTTVLTCGTCCCFLQYYHQNVLMLPAYKDNSGNERNTPGLSRCAIIAMKPWLAARGLVSQQFSSNAQGSSPCSPLRTKHLKAACRDASALSSVNCRIILGVVNRRAAYTSGLRCGRARVRTPWHPRISLPGR
jgi:hypothetical protein